MKQCTKCKEYKALDLFYRSATHCKACFSQYQKEWRAKNQKRTNERQKEYYHNPETKQKVRIFYLMKYWPHMERQEVEAEYQRLFDLQNGKCGICQRNQSEFKDSLCVDHNHQTGQVRGLLCKTCNQGLGYLKGDSGPFYLNMAIQYLDKNTQKDNL